MTASVAVPAEVLAVTPEGPVPVGVAHDLQLQAPPEGQPTPAPSEVRVQTQAQYVLRNHLGLKPLVYAIRRSLHFGAFHDLVERRSLERMLRERQEAAHEA